MTKGLYCIVVEDEGVITTYIAGNIIQKATIKEELK